LAITFFLILILHWLATSQSKPIVAFRGTKTLVYALILFGVVVFGIFFRVMLFGVFVIPSSSMERTIIPGDVVWVNKLMYGPQMPTSPYQIPWIGPIMWLINGDKSNLEKTWWNNRRFKGYSKPKVNDVVVFNQPNNNQVYIKRCMATPGDTFQIVNGEVYVNHQPIKTPEQAVLVSRVAFNKIDKIRTLVDSLTKVNGNVYHPYWETSLLALSLSKKEIELFESHPDVDSVYLDPYRSNAEWGAYPWRKSLSWDLNNYGPLVLPKAGMKIPLTQQTFDLYEQVINNFDNHKIEQKGDKFYINSILSHDYTFSNDFFFMLGDNRHDSEDSRYFGLVPEHKIIGKATGILLNSKDWKSDDIRIFKSLNP
jgi:signal peptidase I